nr:hypothetical protein [Candidatus Microthrix parvicella]
MRFRSTTEDGSDGFEQTLGNLGCVANAVKATRVLNVLLPRLVLAVPVDLDKRVIDYFERDFGTHPVGEKVLDDLRVAVCSSDEQVRIEGRQGTVVLVARQAEEVRLSEGSPPQSEDRGLLAPAAALIARTESKAVPHLVGRVVTATPQSYPASRPFVTRDELVHQRICDTEVSGCPIDGELTNCDGVIDEVEEEVAHDPVVDRCDEKGSFSEPLFDSRIREKSDSGLRLLEERQDPPKVRYVPVTDNNRELVAAHPST